MESELHATSNVKQERADDMSMEESQCSSDSHRSLHIKQHAVHSDSSETDEGHSKFNVDQKGTELMCAKNEDKSSFDKHDIDVSIEGFKAVTDEDVVSDMDISSEKMKLRPSQSVMEGVKQIKDLDSDKPFKCTMCLRSYKQRKRLIEHMKQHAEYSRDGLHCSICGDKFSNVNEWDLHMKSHDNQSTRMFSCNICSKSFLKKSHLFAHMRSHSCEGSFDCHVCDETFPTENLLQDHIAKLHVSEFERENSMYEEGSYLSVSSLLDMENEPSLTDGGKDIDVRNLKSSKMVTETRSCSINKSVKGDQSQELLNMASEIMSEGKKAEGWVKHRQEVDSMWTDVASEVMSDIKKFQSGRNSDSSPNSSKVDSSDSGPNSLTESPIKSIKDKSSPENPLTSYLGQAPSVAMMKNIANSVINSYMSLSEAPSENSCSDKQESNENKPHKCAECGYQCATMKSLNDHMMLHTNERPYLCEICNKTFATNTHLTAHLYVHTREKSFPCDHCEQTFKTNALLLEHLRSHSNIPCICKFCNRIFPDQELLINHLETHTGDRPYVCAICEKSFTKLKNLNEHKKIHIDEKNFMCEICNKGFIKNSYLMAHMVVHRGERPFECDECGHTFKALKRLNEHKKKHRRKEAKSYPCEICGRSFQTYNMYTIHMGIHTGERPYPCDECDKSYKTKRHLLEHKMIHAGQGMFPCTLCNRTFSAKSQLTVHIRTHTGEKPYECPFCQKSFTRYFGLNQHVMTHTGVKPYTCGLCDERFISKPMLGSHMLKAHNSETMDLCRPCKTSFLTKAALEEHKPQCPGKTKIPSVDDGFDPLSVSVGTAEDESKNSAPECCTCYICMRTFTSSSELKGHFDTHMKSIGKPSADSAFFTCPVCFSFFIDKETLDDHLDKTHPTAKKDLVSGSVDDSCKSSDDPQAGGPSAVDTFKYHCKACNCNFSEKFHYQQHMLTHINSSDRTRKLITADPHSSEEEAFSDEDSISSEELENDSMDDSFVNVDTSMNSSAVSKIKIKSKVIGDTEVDTGTADSEHGKFLKRGRSSGRRNSDSGVANGEHYKSGRFQEKDREYTPNSDYEKEDGKSTEGNSEDTGLPTKCNTCGIAFMSLDHYIEHSAVHPQVKGEHALQPEETVNVKVKAKNGSEERSKTKTSSQQPYICQECGESFKHLQNYVYHQKVHSLEKRKRICQKCYKVFNTERQLTVHHVEEHGSDRPYQCECGKTFKLRKHLKQHNETHNRERPFECDICHKAFMKNNHLREHMRSHTGEKPFLCQYCNKSFTRKYLLSHHKCTPLGTKNGLFRCSYCSEEFASAVTLAQHANDVHSAKVRLCDICVKPFDTDAALQDHIVKDHAFKGGDLQESDNSSENFDTHIQIKSEPPDTYDDPDYKPSPSESKKISRSHLSRSASRRSAAVKLRSSNKDFQCSSCSLNFADEEKLRSHICLDRQVKGDRKAGNTKAIKGENYAVVKGSNLPETSDIYHFKTEHSAAWGYKFGESSHSQS